MSRIKGNIVICMGSSCFSRGNNKNLFIIEEFIKKNDADLEITFSGNLCQEECSNGPNIKINDKSFNKVEPGKIKKLLEQELLNN